MGRVVVHWALMFSAALLLAGCGLADSRSPVPGFMRSKAPDPGTGWTACVRAELNSVMGKPLGAETYRIIISSDAIADRRRAEPGDHCASERYEPIS